MRIKRIINLSRNLLIIALLILFAGAAFLYWKTIPKKEEVAGRVVKEFAFQNSGTLSEWEEKLLAKGTTNFSVVDLDGEKCVKVVSNDSAIALFHKIPLSYEDKPFMSWEWKAEKFPQRRKKEDLQDKKDFDFVAQVYVVFYSRFFLKTKAIQYLWTESVPVGTSEFSPYTNNVKMLVLESGPSETWKMENRDIAKDFKDLFGSELDKDVAAISFMTDADSTGTDAIAYYKNIKVGYLGAKDTEDITDEKKTEDTVETELIENAEVIENTEVIEDSEKEKGGGHQVSE